MSKARGLFDEQIRLEKLRRKQDPLERLSAHIDFEFFRKPLEKFMNKDVDRSKGGRPSYDAVLMFKVLILQRYYNVSDDAMEYAILDRLSFMRLDGIHIANFLDSIRLSKVPNADVAIGFKSTLWVQLGNIAQRVGHTLNIDSSNGHIVGDKEAMELWGRKYQPGWEPKV